MEKIKKIKFKNFIILHIIFLFYSFCGVFAKLASEHSFLSLEFCFYYGISILILGIYAIIWQKVLRKFNLTTAFLNKAVTILWGIIWGIIFFGEKVKFTMIIGAIVVVIGVCFVVISDE